MMNRCWSSKLIIYCSREDMKCYIYGVRWHKLKRVWQFIIRILHIYFHDTVMPATDSYMYSNKFLLLGDWWRRLLCLHPRKNCRTLNDYGCKGEIERLFGIRQVLGCEGKRLNLYQLKFSPDNIASPYRGRRENAWIASENWAYANKIF